MRKGQHQGPVAPMPKLSNDRCFHCGKKLGERSWFLGSDRDFDQARWYCTLNHVRLSAFPDKVYHPHPQAVADQTVVELEGQMQLDGCDDA